MKHDFVHVAEYPPPSASRLKGLSRAGIRTQHSDIERLLLALRRHARSVRKVRFRRPSRPIETSLRCLYLAQSGHPRTIGKVRFRRSTRPNETSLRCLGLTLSGLCRDLIHVEHASFVSDGYLMSAAARCAKMPDRRPTSAAFSDAALPALARAAIPSKMTDQRNRANAIWKGARRTAPMGAAA